MIRCASDTESLRREANQIRQLTLRMIHKAGSGHPGGSLSEVEILVALYEGGILRVDPSHPAWPDRDRFVLSKGHCCPPLYAVLARLGYFPESELWTLRQYGSILQGHPSIVTPGIDSVSGSLGNGLPVGVGMAMAGRKAGRDYRVYVLLGDGELQEGSVWEAAMCAAHHRLNRITAIVDRNRLQINGTVDSILGVEPLEEKWRAFGWRTRRVDGHSFPALLNALRPGGEGDTRPTVVIADTVKGKGVSFMEDNTVWHGKAPDAAELEAALRELREERI